jgi:hypothetical protein
MLTLVVVEFVHDMVSAIHWACLCLGKLVCVAVILQQYDFSCLLLLVISLGIPKLELLKGDLNVAVVGAFVFKHFANSYLNV